MEFNAIKARETIIDKYKNPSNFKQGNGVFEHRLKLSTCSDELILRCDVKNNLMTNITFTGEGCSIMISSTDLFIDLINGKDILTIKKILNQYNKLINGDSSDVNLIEPMIVFKNIHRQANRIQCGWMVGNCVEEIIKKAGA